jgi:hypothetical protein
MKTKYRILAYLGKEEEAWLNYKAGEGYKKAAILRKLIKQEMAKDEEYAKTLQKAKAEEARPKTAGKRIDAAQLVADLCTDESIDPKNRKMYEHMDWGFKNLNRLDPETALALGVLKERLERSSETVGNEALE